MKLTRSSGILLHPTSLPGRYGIGDLGRAAYTFIDFLVEAKQSLWQILPLGPTGYGDSPYASFSSFAGNNLLIDIDALVATGDLSSDDVANVPDFPIDNIDYGWVITWKVPLLEKAAHNFLKNAPPERKAVFEQFCLEQADWLDDYALFMAVKAHFDKKAKKENVSGATWNTYWDKDIALRKVDALEKWQTELAEEIAIRKVWQFYFFRQWQHLHQYANERNIKIIGDLPIFTALDSVDVWANRELFFLDDEAQPTVVAGVPPDYFSETGQLWGNPLYKWKAHKAQNYTWWIRRIAGNLRLVDILRIDHFRGFEAYWEILANEETAINGIWVKGPNKSLFKAVKKSLGDLPIIAEDLGVITPKVDKLRSRFGMPGMKILQFAFDINEAGELGAVNKYLPHNYEDSECIVYTGTHDNDTIKGWYDKCDQKGKELIHRYLKCSPDDDIAWEFIRLAMSSTAKYAIFPMQDVFSLGSESRMNSPSTLGTNWGWRYQHEDLKIDLTKKLAELVDLFGRDPKLW